MSGPPGSETALPWTSGSRVSLSEMEVEGCALSSAPLPQADFIAGKLPKNCHCDSYSKYCIGQRATA
jgi:hypothetical protein